MKDKGIYLRAYFIYFTFFSMMIIVVVKTVAIQLEDRIPVFHTEDSFEPKLPARTAYRIPRRGEILDCNYKPMVTSVSFYDIHMDPTVVDQSLFDEKIGELCEQLQKLYPIRSAQEWERYIRSARLQNKRYLLIKRKATFEEKKQLSSFPIFNKGRLKGGLIDTEETIVRKRPHGELLKRTIGYYRKQVDNVSELRIGLEGAFNDYLMGEYGQEIEQKYGNGWKKTGQITKESVEGATLVTSIDLEIQEVAHTELERQLRNQEAKYGCAIVMDVKTGFVRAIVSLSKTSDGKYAETFNHAIGSREVPGSTFKLASLMALLEDDKIHITDIVNTSSEYRFFDRRMHENEIGADKLSIQGAFERSSNVFTKIVYNSYKHNPQEFVNRLRSFGLADSLDLDIKGEVKPTLYDPQHPNWSGISLPWMAVGYEVQQTPMQTLAFYNAVANGGQLLKPQFVTDIIRGQQIVKKYTPVVLRDHICSPETIQTLRKCLEGVMTNGTGRSLKSSYFTTAGKTGTARILNSDNTYGKRGDYKYIASFVGYFPADEPLYSCIVVISEPKSDIYGSRVSGTVFASIANKVYASSLKHHRAINEQQTQISQAPNAKAGYHTDLEQVFRTFNIHHTVRGDSEWFDTYPQENGVQLVKRNISSTSVPNVVGMSAKDAVFLMEKVGMNVKLNGYGTVVTQSIASGSSVSNEKVILNLK